MKSISFVLRFGGGRGVIQRFSPWVLGGSCGVGWRCLRPEEGRFDNERPIAGKTRVFQGISLEEIARLRGEGYRYNARTSCSTL